MVDWTLTLGGVLGFLLLACFVSKAKLIRKKQQPTNEGIQFPPGALPIIGHLHLLDELHHHSLANLSRKYGSCMFLKAGSIPILIISSPEAAKAALKTQNLVFCSRPPIAAAKISDRSGVLWAPYGDYWRSVRRFCTLELLTAKRVESTKLIRAQEMFFCISRLLESSMKGESMNLTELLSDLTFNTMTRMMLSKSYSGDKVDKDSMLFKELLTQGMELSGLVYLGDYIPWLKFLDIKNEIRGRRVQKQMAKYLQKQIDEHRTNTDVKYDDFLSAMLKDEELSKSDASTRNVVRDMIGGGTDTSAVTIEWAIAELLKNPDVLAKVVKELDEVVGSQKMVNEGQLYKLSYLDAVVKENFRLHPAAPLLPYETTQDCEFDGSFLPKGTRAFINIYAIARDERIWKDPLKFDPERFVGSNIDVRGQDYEVLPFGSGRRGCPGIQLAITMVQYTLANLIHGFDWKMPDGKSFAELDMSEKMGQTVPRAVPLDLIPSARLEPKAYETLRSDDGSDWSTAEWS